MILTDEINVGSVGPEYSFTLSINLANGQHFNMNGTAGGAGDLGHHKSNFVAGGGQRQRIEDGGTWEYRAAGNFAGPNAEQAFGAFETPDYQGSFGMTR